MGWHWLCPPAAPPPHQCLIVWGRKAAIWAVKWAGRELPLPGEAAGSLQTGQAGGWGEAPWPPLDRQPRHDAPPSCPPAGEGERVRGLAEPPVGHLRAREGAANAPSRFPARPEASRSSPQAQAHFRKEPATLWVRGEGMEPRGSRGEQGGCRGNCRSLRRPSKAPPPHPPQTAARKERHRSLRPGGGGGVGGERWPRAASGAGRCRARGDLPPPSGHPGGVPCPAAGSGA